MLIAIAGGALQGIEAAYLARRAGWETVLIDKRADAPASTLCDRFIRADIRDHEAIAPHLKGVDLILPALEGLETLAALPRLSKKTGIPLSFDPEAYQISFSKQKSYKVMERIGLSVPRPFPECRWPVIIKPDRESGSKGVEIILDAAQFEKRFQGNEVPEGWVAQEFVHGPVYSLEVIGRPGNYVTPQVTDIHLDELYDCKAVSAPSRLNGRKTRELEALSRKTAEAIELKGIMDVEVIPFGDGFKILEIDARLPSQTPTVVYWSTGFNMVEQLGAMFVRGELPRPRAGSPRYHVRYEHIMVSRGILRFWGEHIMSTAGPLKVIDDFFGADQAITDYREGSDHWVATLIHSCESSEELSLKRRKTFETIRRWFELGDLIDSSPARVDLFARKTV